MTGRDALSRLFQSAGVVGYQDRDGVWRVKYLEIPAAAAEIVLDESMLVPGSLERVDLPGRPRGRPGSAPTTATARR
jgi:hypothetical protein